ncbi:MAG: hypothetical protein WA213_09890 [Terriglobales bacterium]
MRRLVRFEDVGDADTAHAGQEPAWRRYWDRERVARTVDDSAAGSGCVTADARSTVLNHEVRAADGNLIRQRHHSDSSPGASLRTSAISARLSY